MTETEARDLLRDWPGVGGLEAWIAEQPWQEAPGGWAVSGQLRGWRFRIGIVPGGLRLTGGEPGVGKPAAWTVTG